MSSHFAVVVLAGWAWGDAIAETASTSNQPYQEVCLTDDAFQNRYASFSPATDMHSSKIVFESDRAGNWDIYLMDANGENVKQLTDSDNDERRPSWHPSGTLILYESVGEATTELYTLNLATMQHTKLTLQDASGRPMFASFSPDGQWLVTSLVQSENQANIHLFTNTGKPVRAITDNAWRNYGAKWSPDAGQLVYFSRQDTNNLDDEIYTQDIESTQRRRLTDWPRHNFSPAWSSDGKRIAYATSMEDSRPELYVMQHDGSQQTRLTYNKDGDILPAWSPDGTVLLFTGYRNGSYQICKLLL